MIKRAALVVLVAFFLTNPAEAQLPPYIQGVNEGVCVDVVTRSMTPEEALATGCAYLWWDMAIDEAPEDQRFARRAVWGDLRNIWYTAQSFNRGLYGPRRAVARATLRDAAPGVQGGNVIASWTGSGSKDTESFSVDAAEWRVRWSATATSSVGGSLYITVYSASGERVAAASSGDIRGQRTDSSFVRAPAGRYYLSIISANVNWRIDVIR